MTSEEKQEIINAVISQLLSDGCDITGLNAAQSLDGISTFPAVLTTTNNGVTTKALVSVPISLLTQAVQDVITNANTATSAARSAASGWAAAAVKMGSDIVVIEGDISNLQDADKSLSSLTAYAECSTAANVSAKAVTVPFFSLPTNGGCLHVKMANANTAVSGVTLNVNATGAKDLLYNGSAVSATNTWEDNEVLQIYYDGTNEIYQATNAKGGGGSADRVSFDNSQSGLQSGTVKSAIDETNQKWRVRVTPSDSGDSGSGDSGNEGGSGGGEGSGDNAPTTAFDYYESEPLATFTADYDASIYNPISWGSTPSTSVNKKEVRLKPHSTYTFESPISNITIYPWKRLLAHNSNYNEPTNKGWNNYNNNVIFVRYTQILQSGNKTFTLVNDTDEEVGYVFCVGAGYTGPLTFTLKSSDYVEPSGDEPVEPEPSGGDEPTPSEPEVQYEEYDAEKLLGKMQDMIDDAMQSSSQTPSSEPSQVPSNASAITFNHAANNLNSDNVQAAIEEVNTKVDSIATSDDSSETSLLWEDITHVWEFGTSNAVSSSLGIYYMNKEIGEKFAQSTTTASGYTRNVYKVEPGDKLKFTFESYHPSNDTLERYKYAYYILGANDMVLAVGAHPSNNQFTDKEIDIPSGAELFVFNYRIKSGASSGQSVSIRKNKNNSIVQDVAYKESDLLGMSERKNISNKDVYRNKLLTLAWITDTHGDERNYRRFIEYVDAHAGVIDGILHTGDMNRMSDTDGGFEKTVAKYVSKVPLLPVMGNHDSHGASSSINLQVLSSGSSIWQAHKYVTPFMDEHCVQGGIVGSEECYFYRDFDEYKIRIICLNEYDMPRWVVTDNWQTSNEEPTLNWEEQPKDRTYDKDVVVNYKGLNIKCKINGSKIIDNGDYYASGGQVPWSSRDRDGRFLKQAQVDFLISALLDNKLTDEWGIVIATHQVLEQFETGIANEKFHDGSAQFLSLNYFQDGYILSDIIGAFISHGSLTKTYRGTKRLKGTPSVTGSSDYVTSLPDVVLDNISFSEAKGHIICCLNGHTHNCGCYWLNHCTNPSDSTIKYKVLNINQETGCYMPDSLAQGVGSDSKYNRFNVSDVIRGGSLAQDCFNIISFDTVNHVVQLLRIGADTTDKHIKRDYARISYEYKTSIPEKSGISLIPKNMGTTSERPLNPSNGELFFDNTLGRTIIWNGTKWVEEDGAVAGVWRMGPISFHPTSGIYVGFKYYDTTYGITTWTGTRYIESDGATAGVRRFGSTANRPSSADIYDGFRYNDQTLGKYIKWSSSANAWVNLDGTALS